MNLFDGRKHALDLENKIISHIHLNEGVTEQLVIFQVGENAVSQKYINLKIKLCNKVGVQAKYLYINPENSDEEVFKQITQVLNAPQTGGCIIQMPLPRLSLNSALDLIPMDKDIDLLSSKSIDRFMSGDTAKLPPVVRSVDYFLQMNNINLQGKSAIVVGYGQIVGKPLVYYLALSGAKVSVLDNYKTGDKLETDLLILSAGVPNLVNGEDISSGCSVIDFGSSVIDGKTVGDLNMHSAHDHLSNVSPSPGGMGPLVVRFLVMNFLGI